MMSLILKPRCPSALVPCPLSPAGALIITPIHSLVVVSGAAIVVIVVAIVTIATIVAIRLLCLWGTIWLSSFALESSLSPQEVVKIGQLLYWDGMGFGVVSAASGIHLCSPADRLLDKDALLLCVWGIGGKIDGGGGQYGWLQVVSLWT